MSEPNDPTTIDWPERQARALIPFNVRSGRPFVPLPLHGDVGTFPIQARGRNGLPLWGENPEAAALVTCTYAGRRWVLLAQRPDDGTWAMPSGPMNPDGVWHWEGARVCKENAELHIAHPVRRGADTDEPRWVPDPRGSMEAWVVLVVTRFDLGEVESLPEVRGEWVALDELVLLLDPIFPAHREILAGVR